MPSGFADVVVLVPGITGSVLERDGREVWGTSIEAVLRGLLSGGNTIASLRLDGDDAEVDDLGDGVRATRLVNDVHLFPGICAIDGYTKISKRLRQRLSLSPGTNYFEFPYDWRRDNRVAARGLRRMSGEWLQRRRQTHPNAKLVLIAHSMGGLVSRHFLEVLGGWTDTRFLITFGTPYRGSMNALDSLINGVKTAGVLDVTELTRSFTSIYQLLPIYPCIDTGDRPLLRVTEALEMLPFSDEQRARVRAAEGFHRAIQTAVDDNGRLVSAETPRYDVRPILGIDQPTGQTARLRGGTLEIVRARDSVDESGDGTVPRLSATPIEAGETQATFQVGRHGSLQNADAVLAQVYGILTRPRELDLVRSVHGDVTLSLDIEQVFSHHDAVRFAIKASSGGVPLEVRIADINGAMPPRSLNLESRDDWITRDITLAPGVYRLVITGDPTEVEPLSEVFTVV